MTWVVGTGLYSILNWEGRKEGGGLLVFHWQCGVLGGESGYEDRKSVPVLGYSIFIDIGTKRVGVCEAESA